MTIHSEGITDADLDRFEKVAEPIYRSTATAGEVSRFQVSDLGMWVIRLVAEVRRLRTQSTECDGSGKCSAPRHVHGCYTLHRADQCDSPDEYGHLPSESEGEPSGASVRVHEVDGEFVVADGGGWLPGVFPTREAALRAAGVRVDYAAKTRELIDHFRSALQGEPSDAQVRAAAESLAHSAGYIPEPMVRAALRAAGGVR